MDFFRAESIHLKSHWIMVVMDQFTRRIVGFCVHGGDLSGLVICRMFNKVLLANVLPKYLSTENDALFKFADFSSNNLQEFYSSKIHALTCKDYDFQLCKENGYVDIKKNDEKLEIYFDWNGQHYIHMIPIKIKN